MEIRTKYKYIMIMTTIMLESLVILLFFLSLWWVFQKIVFQEPVSVDYTPILTAIEFITLFLIITRIYLGGKKLYLKEGEDSVE